MIEAFEVGVSLALSDGVSEEMAKARQEVALLEAALTSGGVSIRRLRETAMGEISQARAAPELGLPLVGQHGPEIVGSVPGEDSPIVQPTRSDAADARAEVPKQRALREGLVSPPGPRHRLANDDAGQVQTPALARATAPRYSIAALARPDAIGLAATASAPAASSPPDTSLTVAQSLAPSPTPPPAPGSFVGAGPSLQPPIRFVVSKGVEAPRRLADTAPSKQLSGTVDNGWQQPAVEHNSYWSVASTDDRQSAVPAAPRLPSRTTSYARVAGAEAPQSVEGLKAVAGKPEPRLGAQQPALTIVVGSKMAGRPTVMSSWTALWLVGGSPVY